MKKWLTYTVLAIITIVTVSSCSEDNDDVFAGDNAIKNFVYRGMNAFYLYKPDVAVLADGTFETIEELEEFHQPFETPESFFESLIFDRTNIDKFSVIVDDFIRLEQLFAGTSLSNGMEFGLVGESGSATNVYGYVRYVLPNSDAAAQGIERGFIFNQVDGIQITRENVFVLLGQDSYTIGLADLSAGVATYNGTDIALTKGSITENPIFLTTVIDQGSQRIGYLMYNSFTANFDEELNNAFGDLQAQGITHLVLDLRYNGGGSVTSSIILGSLISGQPTSDVFSTEEWNPDLQAFFEANNPDRLTNFFRSTTTNGTNLNTLGLPKVHVITTGSSASASELVMIALEPYIDVVHVGDDTAGKFQASTTLYDSANFSRADANPAHRYALQPQIFKSVNSAGFTDFRDGLEPDIALREDFENLGRLGDPTEPLLAACLADIQANGRPAGESENQRYELISGSMEMKPFSTEMYVELDR